jgi:hypothetical protein
MGTMPESGAQIIMGFIPTSVNTMVATASFLTMMSPGVSRTALIPDHRSEVILQAPRHLQSKGNNYEYTHNLN